MSLQFRKDDHDLCVNWCGSSAAVSASQIVVAHMGCKLLGTLESVPDVTQQEWITEFGRNWKQKNDAKQKLARTLEQALELTKLQGIALWDTMRSGSDYWRPGKLLRDVVELMPDGAQHATCYHREDFFCPPADLLDDFRTTPEMSFAEYAVRYGQYLNTGSILPLAAAHVVFNLSRNQLPLFYCVDPYIPHYADCRQFGSRIPYAQRSWSPEFRSEGCHRVILVEEIARTFLGMGIDRVAVVEIDQTFDKCHVRELTSLAG